MSFEIRQETTICKKVLVRKAKQYVSKSSQPVEKLPAELLGKQMSLTALRESENGKETQNG